MSKLLEDPCCFLCKSAHGICRTQGRCDHHVEARKRQDANDRARHLYNDPTGNQAVNNIMRAQNRRNPKRPFNYPKEER